MHLLGTNFQFRWCGYVKLYVKNEDNLSKLESTLPLFYVQTLGNDEKLTVYDPPLSHRKRQAMGDFMRNKQVCSFLS